MRVVKLSFFEENPGMGVSRYSLCRAPTYRGYTAYIRIVLWWRKIHRIFSILPSMDMVLQWFI